jgi:peptide/nickel transport system substrate-binding protein
MKGNMKRQLTPRTLFPLMAVLVVLAMVVTACSAIQGPPDPEPEAEAVEEAAPEPTAPPEPTVDPGPVTGGTLTFGLFRDAVGLDPHIATGGESQIFYDQVYSTLIRYEEDLSVRPGLAEEWDVSSDGLSYTFYIREGVKFTNGRDLTADDVKYSIERIVELGGSWSSRFNSVTEINVLSPLVLEIKLSAPFAPFLTVLADGKAAIVAREAVGQYGDLQSQSAMIGTGPFILAEYEPGNFARYTRNPDYWETGYPLVDELVFKILPDEAARIAALQTGEVDIAYLFQSPSADIIESVPGLEVNRRTQLSRSVLLIQTATGGPLDDVRVRQALMLAMDRQEIIDLALDGSEVVSGPFPLGLAGALLPEELPFYERDVEAAKQLLSDAGHPDGFDFTLYATAHAGIHHIIAEVVQQQWEDIGVNATIEVLDWGVLLDHWRKGTFEMLSMGYGGRADPYYYTYERFHSEASGNASNYVDEKMDELTVAGAIETDQDARDAIYDELQVYIVEQAPMIYISSTTLYFGMQENVNDYRSPPNWNQSYLHEAWLSE